MDKPTLTKVMIEVFDKLGTGQHSIPATYEMVKARCEELGLEVTMDEIKREFRDAAGYP